MTYYNIIINTIIEHYSSILIAPKNNKTKQNQYINNITYIPLKP